MNAHSSLFDAISGEKINGADTNINDPSSRMKPSLTFAPAPRRAAHLKPRAWAQA
ncbi:hypothetical protein [Allorhizobium borbori]|uniref:hypothetical protein n=1 Tax=Allorhizobium borbori TaxID=485907 RepID=UPI0016168543|nr:hypothetical protein [Allorhizobium borbori]